MATAKSFIDLMKRINPNLQRDPEWAAIFKTVSQVIDSVVGQPLEDLKSSADPKRWHRGDGFTVNYRGKLQQAIVNKIEQLENDHSVLHLQLPNSSVVHTVEVSNRKDRTTLINGAIMDGLNYFSDTLSDRDYERVNQWINSFWPYTSADNFVRFMGFIKNMDLNIFQLWSYEAYEPIADPDNPGETTLDYYPVLTRLDNSMQHLFDGGTWYPTSHIELAYDALNSSPPGNDLALLFYLLAPIHLVLERISGSIDIDLTYSVAGVSGVDFFNGAVEIDLDAPDVEPVVFYYSHMVLDGDDVVVDPE